MNAEITTMIMITDGKTGKVLVIDRQKKYPGISFVGGHVEKGESIYACAVREVAEETGLEVKNLKLCGIIDWAKSDKEDRYIEFLYKTDDFCGTLKSGTDEGPIFWLDPKEFETRTLSPNFAEYLPMFLSEKYSEAFGEWTENDDFCGLTYL